MGIVLTVMNMKGGVGKTTISCHFAGLAAREALGRPGPSKVLLIDYDPQYNASQSYLTSRTYFDLEEKRKTVLSVLMDDPAAINPFTLQPTGSFPPPPVKELAHRVISNNHGHLDIVPSTLSLMYVALGQPNRSIAVIQERFATFVASARAMYDLVVIDCHPAGSVFTQSSLAVSDHVLIPVRPEGFAVRGLGLMRQFIEGRGPQASIVRPHILFNHVGATRSNEENQIRGDARFAPLCLRNSFRKWKHLSIANEGKNFVWNRVVRYQPDVMNNLRQTFTELMGRINHV